MNGKLVGKCSNCGSEIYDDKHYVDKLVPGRLYLRDRPDRTEIRRGL